MMKEYEIVERSINNIPNKSVIIDQRKSRTNAVKVNSTVELLSLKE